MQKDVHNDNDEIIKMKKHEHDEYEKNIQTNEEHATTCCRVFYLEQILKV